MFKGLKQKYENVVNRWLFSEEIKEHQRQVESGIVPRPQQNVPSETELREEAERIQQLFEEQMALIKAEDHSQIPSDEDVKRYHGYHCNMVENLQMIKEKTGQEPPFAIPERPLTEEEYECMVTNEGWNGMRMSCGLPTGDLSKPKKPWTMADAEKKWTLDDGDKDPEIHWKTKE